MRHALAAVLAVVAVASAAADKHPRTNYTAADPALRLVERADSAEKGSFARWRGTLELTGKLVIEFDRAGDGPDADPDGRPFFEPDAESLKKLPAATGYYPLAPKVIELQDSGRKALERVLGKPEVEKIMRGKGSRYEAPAKVTLRALHTGVDCDQRTYLMEYSGVALLAPQMVAQGKAKNGSC